MTQPLFTDEGEEYYAAAYAHNRPFAKPGPYNTTLTPDQEKNFRAWVATRKVPFDPDASVIDYDMRGFWRDDPSEARKWRRGEHFPDTYKTPYDTTFSNESKYATKDNPFKWDGDGPDAHLVDQRNGQVIFAPPQDDRPAKKPSSFSSESGYGTRWWLDVVHSNGQTSRAQLHMVSTGNGETHWELVTPLSPGDRLKISGRGTMSIDRS